ncbi:Stp1/IreP family PP2C-type Ser/Thr phosphatase [Exiguobacterium sp. SH3S2]|nr:Stp1/IreP family PP2C-type Ser/Thr phosphatase [Exiguobacterium sp. SH5S4]TCI37739.1 Stp1/IreP family PP2C-type Ser/Thr phosphatase [Exiguobacterium sp. SH4S7]TCI45608.1 Stp1/IreP family PP2C-type Ser/Thr phosphatase [Exiguobacterium sp. SH5S32]TCI49377.1 Stp1/IreP family PP2C-type Ser/Thr phosphatase [Exiguobacterium sp. SH3S3]TCI52820.1 Stp1/IreP family PP2C-type Ser/Thr phosphatase [Exiguobacterium sp. SH1S4]TCI58136.1 Stp1/IreP family PP2C-type Ser/Thr phosphatase [Exiguobacterium sp. S
MRAQNEDAVLILGDEHAGIALVADGMGGHEAGEVASGLVIEQFRRAFPTLPATPLAMETWFRDNVELANEQVLEFAKQSNLVMMGTTIAGVCWHDETIVIVHIGDSRVYALRGGTLQQLTEDHSYVNVLKQLGELTEEEMRIHPKRNIITRAIGSKEHVEPDLQVFADPEFDTILICTDGLTTHLTDEAIKHALTRPISADAKADMLIDQANRLGGSDNITVALVQFTDRKRG